MPLFSPALKDHVLWQYHSRRISKQEYHDKIKHVEKLEKIEISIVIFIIAIFIFLFDFFYCKY